MGIEEVDPEEERAGAVVLLQPTNRRAPGAGGERLRFVPVVPVGPTVGAGQDLIPEAGTGSGLLIRDYRLDRVVQVQERRVSLLAPHLVGGGESLRETGPE